MKFCIALLAIATLVLIANAQALPVLSIPGQLEILNMINRTAFANPKKPLNIHDCFCNTTSGPCLKALFTASAEIQNLQSSLSAQAVAMCSGNYLLGNIENPKKTQLGYTAYKLSDFNPANVDSPFLATVICGTATTSLHVADCTQKVKIGATGPTNAQMATLLNTVGAIMNPPSSICTNPALKVPLANELSRYPEKLQTRFNDNIIAACKDYVMSNVTSMTDFYLNVICKKGACVESVLH